MATAATPVKKEKKLNSKKLDSKVLPLCKPLSRAS